MSGIIGRPLSNPYEIRRYNATKQSVIAKMADYRTIWEAFPKMKDYCMLDPAVRRVADWSRESMLTKGGSLLSIFEKDAKVVYESAENIRHKLYIEDNDLRATIMRLDYTPGQKLGKGRQEFSLWLDVEWYAERDLLLLDCAQESPILIRSMNPDGALWEYRCVLVEDGWINADDISIGDRVHQIGAARGEAADARGTVHFGEDNSYIEFSTPVTKFGWEFQVTDLAWKAMQRDNQFYTMAPKGEDGKWMMDKVITATMLDFKFKAATDRQIDRWLTYGKAAGKFEGAYIDRLTQKAYKLGPGFYEWMKYAKTDYYNPNSFSIEWLANIMTKRWHNNVAIEDRVVDFGTGTLGLTLFHEAAMRYSGKSALEPWNINNETTSAHDKKHTGVIVNKKTYVGVFLPNFGTMRVHHLPHLDDDKFEKARYRGYSIRSGEFIAMNTGFGNGAKANIYIVKDPGENGFGYGIGLWTPHGPTFKNPGLNGRWPTTEGKKNQYSLIRDEGFTIVVKDPYAIMWLKPALKRAA